MKSSETEAEKKSLDISPSGGEVIGKSLTTVKF